MVVQLSQTPAVTGHERWLEWFRMFVAWFINAFAIAFAELVDVLRAFSDSLAAERR
jgi:hypothetical protein